jgi:hypothetical protein
LCLDQTNIGRHGMMFLNFDLVVSQWCFVSVLEIDDCCMFINFALVVICCFTCSYGIQESFNVFAS